MSYDTTATGAAFLAEFERWQIEHPTDVRPLVRAAAEHLRLGFGLPISEVAPALAVLYFSVADFESPWLQRGLIYFCCWFMRVVVSPRRPMWNDFYMCLWVLSREPYYVCELRKHLARARAKSRIDQLRTGRWMIDSVCQQDPEFAGCWRETCRAHGEVFA